MSDINSLPNEILVHIFRFYLQSESHLNFISCLSKVCKKWKKLCKNSSNFQSVDGSLSNRTIINLAKAGSLKKTKSLKFGIHKAKSKSPFDKNFTNFYKNLPRLKSLNLENVCSDFDKKKKHSIFTELKDFCPDLCELILGHPEINCSAKISYTIFEEFLLTRGPKLVTLHFSRVNIQGIKNVITLIANNCPNLEDLNILDLDGSNIQYFPIEQMQVGCPKLKTLRLGLPFIFSEKSGLKSPGFPQLEMFTYSYQNEIHFKDSSFATLLYKSPDLKILDIRGCQNLSVEAVHSLPATDLEQLFLCFSRMTQQPEIVKPLQKWSHSLRLIGLSHITKNFFNEILGPLSLPDGLPELESLDISSTSVNGCTLKHIIQHSPKLSFLNLIMCRSLGRKMRHIYRSRSAIEELLKFEDIDFV